MTTPHLKQSIGRSPSRLAFLLIPLALACFGLLPIAQAVVPPPDGGYPNFTTAEGTKALQSLTTGPANTAVGWLSLSSNTEGSFNTAIGAGTLLFNIGDQNTGEGTQNTATGAVALFSNTTGSFNTANGLQALYSNTTGLFNTAIGSYALANNTTGSGNTALGDFAGSGVSTASNVICIGSDGNNVDNSCYIGNIFDSMVTASAVFVNSNGRLGTMTSSKRFKQDIKPMNNASEALYSLKPVSFRYKTEFDPANSSQLGLVAEDVEKVSRDLVVRDKEGKPYSVRYDQVNAMLLNEFLKEHGKNEEQEKTIAELKSRMEALTATVKQQAAQIQRVSAQIEASKPAPRMVNNP